MGLNAEDLEPQRPVAVSIDFYGIVEQFAERLIAKNVSGPALGKLSAVFEQQTLVKDGADLFDVVGDVDDGHLIVALSLIHI